MNQAFRGVENQELWVNPAAVMNQLTLFKVNKLEEQLLNHEKRLSDIEQEQSGQIMYGNQEIFSMEERGKVKKKNVGRACETDSLQKCEKIVKRITELLDEWQEAGDIKFQIQYAVLIVGKLSNIRKMLDISSDNRKIKICTLLKNAIRLNVTEEIFTEKQISVLKYGTGLLIEKEITTDALSQLNRELRMAGLQTMPAWE